MELNQWSEIRLESCVFYKKGKKPKRLETLPFTDSVPYINIEAFEKGHINQFADRSSSNLCFNNDILVVWDGARFGLAATNQEGAIGSTLMALSPILIQPEYLLRFIQNNFELIQQHPKGTGIPHVNPEIFWNLKIPLPPLAEQRRIVEKLDAILPKIKAVKEKLEKMPAILKRFRQSVLADACSGKLTEDWRGGDDIEGFLEETLNGYSLDKESIPYSWSLYKIGTLSTYLNGYAFKSNKFLSNGHYQVIRIGNIKKYGLDLEEKPVFIEKKYAEEHQKFKLLKGDIVTSLTGTKYKRDYGYVNMISDSPHELFLNQRVASLRPQKDLITSKYLLYAMQTETFRDMFFSSETGNANQGNVGIDALKYPHIPTPSIREQLEIVQRIDRLLEIVDSLESKYRAANQHINKIEQAVLAKAFRGELALQHPDDEPAEVLLERIMKEKQFKAKK